MAHFPSTVDASEQQLAILAEDAGADVAIVGVDGQIHWAVPSCSWWDPQLAAPGSIGQSLHELFPKAIAEERMEIIRRVVATKRPAVIKGIWRGVRTRTTIRPMPPDSDRSERVMVVCRGYVSADADRPADPSVEVIEAQHVDHGRLGILTPRELEILALIARGMTTAAIAKQLFRSRKTIEAHRLSLGAKLGVRNRVELARIAMESGLLGSNPDVGNRVTGMRFHRAVTASAKAPETLESSESSEGE